MEELEEFSKRVEKAAGGVVISNLVRLTGMRGFSLFNNIKTIADSFIRLQDGREFDILVLEKETSRGMIKLGNVNFAGDSCNVYLRATPKGNTILLRDKLGLPVATASVFVDRILNKDEVVIKNWSENEGILQTLINANILKFEGKTVRINLVIGYICRIVNYEKLVNEKNNKTPEV